MTKTPKVDDLGYLFDPWDWTEELAVEFAEQEDITLTEDHWEVINFMREYFEEKMKAPEARHTVKHLSKCCGVDRNRLFVLFPYGYEKQACRIAGMMQPRAWTTG
jgi:tRNA 2-thiouridine synthesizing protein E